MTDEPDISPFYKSSTFWGKTVTQIVLVVNSILKSNGKPAINVEPELTILIATVLEGMYMSWRHHNRVVINKAKVQIKQAEAKTKIEGLKTKAIVAKTKAKPTRR